MLHASIMPAGWQWPDASVRRLSRKVWEVASSSVRLLAQDAGAYCPKVEHAATLQKDCMVGVL